ncbi:oxidoreductase, short-chain dehydrogenase/reductase family, putative [Paecilomyces variotii No. 5]|uniref:Oxidoreductase, short-chain dehydrogenase/reductase family, putative n=1 Tax=Byssochlamys spectabilis (strain No. 5 / NBRC 109023) TaxID=1356009 RepID=V5HWE1_BYSSN|nr:oxidoreductase, short-chain dehydrogenase/reductase family, putative [Paecilomyces variotii No. 5]
MISTMAALFAKMAHFGHETKGTDVVAAFPDAVRHGTFVITEPSKGGLGAAIALALAEGKPACLILVGKFQGDSQPVVDEINRRFPTVKSLFISADFGNFESVRGAAKILKELGVPIDGIIASETITGLQYEKTDDGIESQFQVNYLSHFLLINSLLDTMPKRKATRAVLVASSIRPDAAVPNFDDYNFSDGKTYHPLEAYAQSKLANVLFAKSLAKSASSNGIAAFSVNPGNIKTNLQTYLSPELVKSWLDQRKDAGEEVPLNTQQAPKSLPQGCGTVLRALLDPSLEDLDSAAGEQCAKQLWELSERLLIAEVLNFSSQILQRGKLHMSVGV